MRKATEDTGIEHESGTVRRRPHVDPQAAEQCLPSRHTTPPPPHHRSTTSSHHHTIHIQPNHTPAHHAVHGPHVPSHNHTVTHGIRRQPPAKAANDRLSDLQVFVVGKGIKDLLRGLAGVVQEVAKDRASQYLKANADTAKVNSSCASGLHGAPRGHQHTAGGAPTGTTPER